jgi:hypothetical protein
VTRRERIAFLLAHYSDVLAGVRDRGLGGDHLPLMCSAWNGVSYQELERLLPLFRADARPLYRAIVGTYVYPRFVRRAVCPKCGIVKPPNLVGEIHVHPNRKSATFITRMVRRSTPSRSGTSRGRLDGSTTTGAVSPTCRTTSRRSWPWRERRLRQGQRLSLATG